jgi:hypothetical protein
MSTFKTTMGTSLFQLYILVPLLVACPPCISVVLHNSSDHYHHISNTSLSLSLTIAKIILRLSCLIAGSGGSSSAKNIIYILCPSFIPPATTTKIYFEAGAGEGVALSSPLSSAPACSSSEQPPPSSFAFSLATLCHESTCAASQASVTSLVSLSERTCSAQSLAGILIQICVEGN